MLKRKYLVVIIISGVFLSFMIMQHHIGGAKDIYDTTGGYQSIELSPEEVERYMAAWEEVEKSDTPPSVDINGSWYDVHGDELVIIQKGSHIDIFANNQKVYEGHLSGNSFVVEGKMPLPEGDKTVDVKIRAEIENDEMESYVVIMDPPRKPQLVRSQHTRDNPIAYKIVK